MSGYRGVVSLWGFIHRTAREDERDRTGHCHMEPEVIAPATPDAPATVSATDAAVVSGDVAAYRESRRAERAGKPLESKSADSTPAEPVEQVASTDAGTPAGSDPAPPRKKGADARIQELLADRARDRKELERLQREIAARTTPAPDATPAASSPAPLTSAFPTYQTWLEGHEGGEYEDYLDARAEHRFEVRERTQREARERETRSATVAERSAAFERQYREAVTADERVSTFAETLPVPVDHLPAGQSPTALNVLSQEIYQSPNAVKALTHFATHPEDVQRFAAYTSLDQVVRAFGKLEASWDTPASVATPPKTITSAPTPPTTLGARPSGSASAIDAAVASGDMVAFKAAKLRERAASLR